MNKIDIGGNDDVVVAIGRASLPLGALRWGTAAVLISFTSTCQRLSGEPWVYLKDVQTRLPTMASGEVGDMLPEMPLFLVAEQYVPAPLEATYQTAWAVYPAPLKGALLAPPTRVEGTS